MVYDKLLKEIEDDDDDKGPSKDKVVDDKGAVGGVGGVGRGKIKDDDDDDDDDEDEDEMVCRIG